MSDNGGIPPLTLRQRLDACVDALRSVLDEPGDMTRSYGEFVLVREEAIRMREQNG